MWPKQSGQKMGQRVSGLGTAEHLILLEGVYTPSVIVGEVGGSSGHHNRDVDSRVKARAILGDPDKSI
jgi:hypothetical protein